MTVERRNMIIKYKTLKSKNLKSKFKGLAFDDFDKCVQIYQIHLS